MIRQLKVDFNRVIQGSLIRANARRAVPGTVLDAGAVVMVGDDDWERAALASRAYIRHRHTDYEELLSDLDLADDRPDSAAYREIKRVAHMAVDAFLAAHREWPK